MDAEATVPVVYIDPSDDWTVDDLQTVEDCDEAIAFLTGAISSIEAKLSDLRAEPELDRDLYSRTFAARRWKHEAMRLVRIKRGQFLTEKEQRAKAERRAAYELKLAQEQAAKAAEKAERIRLNAEKIERQKAEKAERDRTSRLICSFLKHHHPEIYQQAVQFAESFQTTEKAA